MINPKHSTAKTHKANDRPEKQSNKNKNQWNNDTIRSKNMNAKPSIKERHVQTDNALSTCQYKRRENTKQLYLKAYNGRFLRHRPKRSEQCLNYKKIVPMPASVAKQRRCAAGPSVKTMLCDRCAAKTRHQSGTGIPVRAIGFWQQDLD